MEKLLTVAEAADLLGWHHMTVRKKAVRPDDPLPTVRIGGSIRIRPADLDAWVARQGTTAKAKSTPT